MRARTKATEREYFTISELSGRTGLSKDSIRRAIYSGELSAYLVCGRYRIRLRDFDDFMERGLMTPERLCIEQKARSAMMAWT